MADRKDLIIRELEVLRKKETADGQTFKARAYGKVIAGLKAHTGPVRNISDVAEVAGIGAKILEKIKEILATGHLEAADAARASTSLQATDDLLKIYGIGPVKARELIAAGIRTYAQLREKADELLNEKQKIGLKYVDDFVKRIPRPEMDAHAARIREYIQDMEIVGSYRRGAADSGDIDVLIRATPRTSVKKIIDAMTKDGYITEELALGDKKFMGVVRLDAEHPARRFDLLLTPPEEYAYAVLYFTGSDKFNIGMRQHALSRGYTLNEHGMKPTHDAPVPPVLRTEREIFEFLGLEYVDPKDRSEFLSK